MRSPLSTLRSSAGTAMATSGYLPVPHHPACRATAQPVPGAWSARCEAVLGGSQQPLTALFEGLAIAWLKHASQKAVGEQLRLSWDEIHGIMERAVERGLARRQAEEIPYL